MKKIGNTEIQINGQGISASILKLYPYIDEDTQTTKEHILDLVKEKNIVNNVDEKIIEYYLERAIKYNKTYNNVLIAYSNPTTRAGSNYPVFSKAQYKYYQSTIWTHFENLVLENHDVIDDIPYPLVFHKKGDIIVSFQRYDENTNGTNIFGDSVLQARVSVTDYFAGENVIYDDAKKIFIAGVSGYLLLKESRVSIISPFQVSENKMNLYYYNFAKTSNDYPNMEDITDYLTKFKINKKYLLTKDLSTIEKNSIVSIAEGIKPGESVDAWIEFFFSIEKEKEKNEDKKIDYREILSFTDASEEEVLAIKHLPITGDFGEDIFGSKIQAKKPKDIILKNGLNSYKVEKDLQEKIISKVDGVIEYKNNIISVFPQLYFNSNIDYGTGNIDTKVNVHITGNVLTGFTVRSKKNIYIGGLVEDSCIIEADGDIYIKNGASGANTIISAGGKLTAKFIEGCKLTARDNITVQRFILGSKVECGNSVIVMGSGINLNEKGAIIDCDLKIKYDLIIPTIGNEYGTKTSVSFAYDQGLNNRINNLKEAIDKLNEQIAEIKGKFKDDITSPTIHSIIKNYAKSVKDEIIEAIQEINKLDNKLSMLQVMLIKETDTKNDLLKNSKIQISKKVFPPLNLECDGVLRIFDSIQPPSVFYFDIENKKIERSRYFGAQES
ncbi:MAG TPA: FapA family protein [Candidatus Cloacimonadota bacterium]|nr:FapA family protein [Candidatus Cloacimonadota bacterium]